MTVHPNPPEDDDNKYLPQYIYQFCW